MFVPSQNAGTQSMDGIPVDGLGDRDLLVRLDERVGNLHDVFTSRFTELAGVINERDKRDEEWKKDHENRLRSVERRLWSMPSAAIIISCISLFIMVYNTLMKSK